jgi:hypothetical protein
MKVLTQVEAISNLNGGRSTDAGGFGILSRSITTDDLDGRVTLEPGGDRSAVAIRSQIKSPPSLQVANDRPVSKSTTPGPVIKAHHPRRLDGIIGETTQQPQNRVRATGHGQESSETPGCFSP